MVRSFLTQTIWDKIFGDKDEAFNFEDFLFAVDSVQGVCSGTSWYLDQIESCKIEIATFLAHVAHETNSFNDAFEDTDEWFESRNSGMFETIASAECSGEGECKRGPLMMVEETFN